ncbi:EscN/YscN/HrcN family type III secretion system ATPase [Bradymonadaceae bacterium TMQ3]|uniref:Type 3 secretion system ATPase n=1 Tax=Lujinxingia sediminis TaxID=2480984 RepID=A0ABY0CVJ2_9DELT|nr:type III secretion system ATPase SctN [Lujinxingia sediminis]RDV40066.1 EscN/YscN/HrcN family type III secretion system ATPase [Bradymonadaceae bacterium TMQ3]RVU47887.1 EscN/YscN/HrcN family type III secretion system ATPase [Lujinxingia sediminis]TXC77189.1 EscN/YscN/HrcN family type III secretion system ATPase [Bradymonadales bacterium TMQ1]
MPLEQTSILSRYMDRLDAASPVRVTGRVQAVTGLVVKASVPDAAVGELVEIRLGARGTMPAEVVGFEGDLAVLMPLGSVEGIGPGAEVESTGQPLSIHCGPGLLGRVLDGLGRPIDAGPPLGGPGFARWPILREAPDPFKRRRITAPLSMGVRAIDGLLTVGKGQRVGLFAGSGVGKSTLMGQIARGCDAEVIVIALIGERGREVRDFLEEVLGEEGMKKAVVVVATSDAPSMVRLKSAFVATAIAEYFRAEGAEVLMMMDSVTRFARAQREVGLAAGEPPARQGYPPSVFSMLPRLLERTGNDETGSITALYTVLVAGGDMEEPIADEVRGILDGHIILSRKLASRSHWPAIDVLPSLSRVMRGVTSPQHVQVAERFRQVLATYESRRDLISLGAYEYGADEEVDFAIDCIEEMEAVLKQGLDEHTSLDETIERISDLFA